MQVIRYARKMGLDMIQGDHEDAPGQLELNWMFDDVLRNADRLTTYRQICAQVARENGIFACFMTKPFMGVSASGCHHNMSLWRGGKDEMVKCGNDPKDLPGMVLGTGLRGLGLPEPHNRSSRLGSGPVRVPLRGQHGEPVSDGHDPFSIMNTSMMSMPASCPQ